MTVYVTGDTHGSFKRVKQFCKRMKLTSEDVVIILGDAGLNYYLDCRDRRGKHDLAKLAPTFFCIHGNHEERPFNISSYAKQEAFGGVVWVEKEFPNILFAEDGEIYDFEGFRCIAIGGAYSVDKDYRLERGWTWFADEQPDDAVKRRVEEKLAANEWNVDIVLSHTVPRRYQPTEVFLSGIDQSTVDTSTEDWLQEIESKLTYKRWFAGHYHTQKQMDKLRLMFEDWTLLSE